LSCATSICHDRPIEQNIVILSQSIFKTIQRLKSNADCINIKRRSYIYLEEDPSDNVYILEQGMVMLTKLLPNGQEVGIVLLAGENMFGQCEVLSHLRREHQAMALTTCKLRAVRSDYFLKETECSNKFSLELAKLQNERLRRVEKHIGIISQHNIAKRLSSTLLSIVDSAGSVHNRLIISPCPTHQDLAIMIASTRETVSTIMGKLRQKNIIDFNRQELRIINEASLQSFGTHCSA